MTKLMQELEAIFKQSENEYDATLDKRIKEFYHIIIKELKKGIKDTSKGRVSTYTYTLEQGEREQVIQPFELLTEALQKKFEGDGLNVTFEETYMDDGQRTAVFMFSGWDSSSEARSSRKPEATRRGPSPRPDREVSREWQP